jgi:UrcA family protein
MKMASWIASLAIGAAAAVPGVVLAQQAAPEEIVVTGRFGDVPDRVQTLSQAVSYADLDLSTKEGREMLRHRIDLTARFLCDKLGESTAGSPLVASCRDAARRDALSRVGKLEEAFAPRGTTWVRPPAWTTPYPADWYTKYPYTPEK